MTRTRRLYSYHRVAHNHKDWDSYSAGKLPSWHYRPTGDAGEGT